MDCREGDYLQTDAIGTGSSLTPLITKATNANSRGINTGSRNRQQVLFIAKDISNLKEGG